MKLFVWDWVGIFYNVFMGGILIFFNKGFPLWYKTSFIHVLIIAAIFGVIALYHKVPNKFTRFLRYLYPVLLTGYYYGETQDYIFIMHSGWFDQTLINLEAFLFGSEITLMVERIAHPWLTEFIIFGYLTYYPLATLGPFYLYLKGSERVFQTVITAFVITFTLSLPQFFLFPVQGPRWQLVDQYVGPVLGYWSVDVVYGIMRCCAVHGGAMPSTHTAIAMIVVYGLWYVNRKFFWIYLPFFIGLILGTFWGRFHYLSDTVVGAAIAIFALYVGDAIQKRKGNESASSLRSSQ